MYLGNNNIFLCILVVIVANAFSKKFKSLRFMKKSHELWINNVFVQAFENIIKETIALNKYSINGKEYLFISLPESSENVSGYLGQLNVYIWVNFSFKLHHRRFLV